MNKHCTARRTALLLHSYTVLHCPVPYRTSPYVPRACLPRARGGVPESTRGEERGRERERKRRGSRALQHCPACAGAHAFFLSVCGKRGGPGTTRTLGGAASRGSPLLAACSWWLGPGFELELEQEKGFFSVVTARRAHGIGV